MPTTSQLRVIIVGGSVTGLTLANCFEKAGIGYVLLERGAEIVYEGGASIGLMANGLRIMDQLDVFEAIRKTTVPLAATYHRNPDGIAYSSSNYMPALEARHGYPSLFFERQELLQILHNRLTDPSKVLTSKKVVEIQTNKLGVQVTTADGAIYDGDIIIGADGVHSTVRHSMWKDIEPKYPTLVARESTALFSEYCCMFGISIVTEPYDGFTPGVSNIVYDHDIALGAIIGINGKVFWFVFIKMEKKYYAPNIPRFSSADADALAEKHKHRKFSKDATFDDLWRTRSRFTLVALEEGVTGSWFNERTVLIGDSAHKMTPNAGQGGNTAIEGAALLTNLLYRARAEKHGEPFTQDDFTKIFVEYQSGQKPRAETMFEASTLLTRLQTHETGPLEFLATYGLPVLGDSFQINIASGLVLGGVKLDFLDKPLKIGKIPWEGWSPWAAAVYDSVLVREVKHCGYLLVSYYAIRRLSAWAASNGTVVQAVAIFASRLSLDGSSLQAANYAVNAFPIVGISLIESLRANSQTDLATLPLIAGIVYQLGGAPLCAVAYFLAQTLKSGNKRNSIPGGNVIEPAYARTLTTTLLLVFPVIALAAAGLDTTVGGRLLSSESTLRTGIWQTLPLFLAITNHALAKRSRDHEVDIKTNNKINGHTDLPILRKTYLVLTIIPALFHMYTIGSALASGDAKQAIKNTVFPRGSWDYVLTFGTGLLWAGWNYSNATLLKGAKAKLRLAANIAGIVPIIGPGALVAALWGLREEGLRAFE